VTGATGSTYVVRAADAGRELRAQVVATTAGGRTVATSNGVGPAGAVRNATAPALIGGAVVGTPVWTDGGSWIGVPAPGVQFGWLRCDAAGNACVPIGGATGPGYTPTSADLGRTLRAGVTATNGFSSATATSAASAPVAAPTPASAPKADRTRPVVSGLAATPRRVRAGRGLTRLAPVRSRRVRTGTILRVRLSEKAFVQVDVTRRRHGRRQIVATLTRVLGKGTHRLGFTGRLSPAQGGTLPRGAYVLAVRATDAAGNVSRERGVGISVVR
jgi:plasmid stabilization system protein ParE